MNPLLIIDRSVWRAMHKIFAGYENREAGCFLFGDKQTTEFTATVLGIPAQRNSPFNFHIDGDALAELIEAVGPSTLVAQVHSHPGSNVSHSPYDDEMIVSRNIFSLVLPYYGRGICSEVDLGCHRFFDGEWRLVDPKTVQLRNVTGRIVDLR